MRQLCLLFALGALIACTSENPLSPTTGATGASGATTGGHPTLSLTCQPCTDSTDCSGGVCAQYAGSDFCANTCSGNADCGSSETCTLLGSVDSSEVQICIPKSATCGSGPGCTNCAAGTTCDVITGLCADSNGGTTTGGTTAGGTTSGSSAGANGGTTGSGSACPGYAGPTESSCCNSCSSSSGTCQANGCYGSWYCDSNTCKCHAPPSNCGSGSSGGTSGGSTGGTSGGTTSGGTTSGGTTSGTSGGTTGGGPAPVGSVGPNGGSVSGLYFAVVGDTRPANPDQTQDYPSAIIDKIYSDIAALNPPPQFVITTGDYMFATPSGSQAQAQISLYMQAAAQFKAGPIFAAMGNHECTGATASNCASSPTSNMNAYMKALVTPLGKAVPYYTIPINDTAGVWTAKIIITACNDWDSAQSSWLQGELAKPTTYTFVVRHEPTGTSGPPCVSAMDSMLKNAKYDLFIVGHSHTFSHSGNQVIIGNGGAPISGSVDYGFATISQQAGGFVVTQYDYMTAMPVGSFTVP